MYCSKPIHKNKHDTSYITIGDPYDAVLSKKEKNPRYQGKQFQTVFPKKGSIPKKVCFEKIQFGPHGKYTAEPLYISKQPLDKRKLGFGSHDASRRDEFSNAVRTTQVRQVISQEISVAQRGLLKGAAPCPSRMHNLYQSKIDALEAEVQQIEDKVGISERIEQEDTRRVNNNISEYLYDIGRSSNTEFNPRNERDRFYAPQKHKSNISYGRTHSTSTRHGMQEGCETKIDRKAEWALNCTTSKSNLCNAFNKQMETLKQQNMLMLQK